MDQPGRAAIFDAYPLMGADTRPSQTAVPLASRQTVPSVQIGKLVAAVTYLRRAMHDSEADNE